MGKGVERPARGRQGLPSPEAVFGELNRLLLEGSDVDRFLRRLAGLAASLAPGTRCVITLRPDPPLEGVGDFEPVTVRSDQLGGIPEQRPSDPEAAESSAGPAAAGLSIPLVVNEVDLGTLRLFAPSSRVFSETEVERLHSFTRQAAPALVLLLRQSAQLVLDDELQDALVTRAVIDQALGVLMHARKITSHQAFEVLRHASQRRNRRVSEIAAEVIEAMTGHPPEPPRPLSQRRAAIPRDSTGA